MLMFSRPRSIGIFRDNKEVPRGCSDTKFGPRKSKKLMLFRSGFIGKAAAVSRSMAVLLVTMAGSCCHIGSGS